MKTERTDFFVVRDVDAAISSLRAARLTLIGLDIPVFREKAILVGRLINDLQSASDNYLKGFENE